MAEDYDPFSAAEDAYDPFAAADAPAPPPPVAIDASQIAAALAQDAAQLRGELESKTKQAVEMQKKRDAETAARKAQVSLKLWASAFLKWLLACSTAPAGPTWMSGIIWSIGSFAAIAAAMSSALSPPFEGKMYWRGGTEVLG